MAFPETQFAGLGLIDYVNGATPQEFFKESDATQWDNELIGLTSNLRSGQFRVVFNDTGVLIEKGKPVKLGAFNVPNSAPEVTLAQADSVANLADGIALADIGIGAVGLIVKRLVITGLDTSAFTVLDDVYLSAGVLGDLTAVVGLQRLGRVTVDDAVTGQIEFDVERGGIGNNPADGVTLENASSILRVKTEGIGTGQLKNNDIRNTDLFDDIKSFRRFAAADLTKNNDTVLGDIFTVSLVNQSRYRFRAVLWFNVASATPDIKLRVDITGGLGTNRFYVTYTGQDHQTFNDGTQNRILQAVNVDFSVLQTFTGDLLIVIEGSFDKTLDALETFKLQFAQQVADVSNTVLKEGSFMTVDGFN